jgi:hypothetical protein
MCRSQETSDIFALPYTKNEGALYGGFYIEIYFAVLLPLRLFTCVKNERNLLQVCDDFFF